MTYLDCWIATAATLFAQALAGEPTLTESLPKPLAEGSFGFAATLAGDLEGCFSVVFDGGILASPLMGEGTDQLTGWAELMREVFDATAGELLARTGIRCRIAKLEATTVANKITRAFLLKAGDRAWPVLVRDEVRDEVQDGAQEVQDEVRSSAAPKTTGAPQAQREKPALPTTEEHSDNSAGIELLLDVELEATLRFGCRELPLGEILELGPGDVVQLDRHISDPVDMVVGDKIVARGEVVLVNGNFGLRVTEVAAPRKRLESIRCLF
jgi:flagellar motor switch protein FliN